MPSAAITRRSLFLAIPVCACISNAQTKSTPANGRLAREVQEALGKTDAKRVFQLTRRMQQTLRNLRSYRQLIVAMPEGAKRDALQRMMDEEIAQGVGITSEMLKLLQEDGLEKIVLQNREEIIKGVSQRALPLAERAILLDAGFSDTEIEEFSTFLANHGIDVLKRVDQQGGSQQIVDKASKLASKPYQKAVTYIKLFGGIVVIGSDIVAGLLAAPGTLGAAVPAAIGSVACGLVMTAEAAQDLAQSPSPDR
jgi:hypothetical protein